jgi:MFS family permease
MASFFPVYADGKYNVAASNSELTLDEDQTDEHAAVISTLEISFCIVAFELACLIASPIHAKTISLMGRKNAILIGFAVQLTCCVLLGFAAYFPVDYPVSFLWYVIVVRLIQGYGDSLSLCCGYSVINLTFTDDRAEKIGMMEAAFGFGCIIGPSVGSMVFGAVGYEWTMYYFAF